MKVRFWGVRGSFPVPGVATNRYGGNTSCVEVRAGDPGDPAAQRIIIDAGTGIRRLGKEMVQGLWGEGKGTAHLLISHTHWDHIQGLPFFSPLYHKGNRLFVYARQRDDTHLRAVFHAQTGDPYFPVPFDSVHADVAFRELLEGARFEIGDVKVSCARLNHPWIATAYRLDAHGTSVAYVTDTAPFRDILFEHEYVRRPEQGAPMRPEDARKLAAMRADLVRLCQGADLLIYDTMFTPAEYRDRPHYGHSTPDDAVEIAREAGVRRLALFHHAPERTDDDQDKILEACRATANGLDVVAAHEGLEVDLKTGIVR
jgi:phosphoribosyl 1,2-cyclic phosphodiesterase